MLWDIAGSDYSGWPASLQSTVACQSAESGPGTPVASAPGDGEKRRGGCINGVGGARSRVGRKKC